ncbi:MAG: glycosyl hydrolase 53 family protein, partial [Chitinispirillales bacterium]|nr:glycosyl hydrolase 53 family protein [Chitinispirillales bacterium]
NPNGWLTSLKNAGVTRIDVFGLSYYSEWHGQPDSLRRVVNAVAQSNANNNIRIAVAEYADNHRAVNDIIFNLPENKRFGTFVWEPCDWRETLFDWNNSTRRRETNSRIALYPVMAEDYGIGDGDDSTSTKIAFVNKNVPFGQVGGTAFSINNNGVITYNSSARGTITVYNVRGRIMKRVSVKSVGTYNPTISLRSGAYVVAVESKGGGERCVFSRMVVR